MLRVWPLIPQVTLALQLGGSVLRPPQSGGFANFATFARSPSLSVACALRRDGRSLPAGSSRPADAPVLARSSNLDPSGPLRQSIGSKRPGGPHSARRGFSRFAPCRSVPQSQFWRVRPRPEELVKAACSALRRPGDRWTSSTVRSPVARAYPTAASAAFFITAGSTVFFQRTYAVSEYAAPRSRFSSSQNIPHLFPGPRDVDNL